MSETVYDKEIVATCDLKHLAMIRGMVEEVAMPCFKDKMVVARIVLAVDEAVANVMEHAYDGLPSGDVHVRIWVEGELFKVTVIDEGHRFDPSKVVTPDIKKCGKKWGKKVVMEFILSDRLWMRYIIIMLKMLKMNFV